MTDRVDGVKHFKEYLRGQILILFCSTSLQMIFISLLRRHFSAIMLVIVYYIQFKTKRGRQQDFKEEF